MVAKLHDLVQFTQTNHKGNSRHAEIAPQFPSSLLYFIIFFCFPCFCTPCTSPLQSCSSNEGSPSSTCRGGAVCPWALQLRGTKPSSWCTSSSAHPAVCLQKHQFWCML